MITYAKYMLLSIAVALACAFSLNFVIVKFGFATASLPWALLCFGGVCSFLATLDRWSDMENDGHYNPYLGASLGGFGTILTALYLLQLTNTSSVSNVHTSAFFWGGILFAVFNSFVTAHNLVDIKFGLRKQMQNESCIG